MVQDPCSKAGTRRCTLPPRSQDQPPKTLKNTQILPPSHPSS